MEMFATQHQRTGKCRSSWHAETGKRIPPPKVILLDARACLITLNGTLLASGSWDKTFKIWDNRLGEAVSLVERPRDGGVDFVSYRIGWLC